MYTEKRYPGKYEGCESAMVGRILSEWQDEELGDVQDFGWYGLIKGKRYWFIVSEDNYGFVDYVSGTPEEIQKKWDTLEDEYSEFCEGDKVSD